MGTVTDSISTNDAIRRIRIPMERLEIVLYKCLRADPQKGTVTDSRSNRDIHRSRVGSTRLDAITDYVTSD